MKKTLFVSPLAFLLIFLGLPEPVHAKGRTVKMTISGGGLWNTIDVMDPRVLEISNIWAGNFLDTSQGTAKEPPKGLQRYEVSLYIKTSDSTAKKRYVFYYYPNVGHDPGYIYLPGKEEPWYSLNVSAILRDGRDGEWNYAFPKWENLIKGWIAAAEDDPYDQLLEAATFGYAQVGQRLRRLFA